MDDRLTRYTPQSDYYGRRDPQDYTRDYGGGRDYTYTSGRDYAASGYGRDRESYGDRDYYGGSRDYYGASRDYGRDAYGRDMPPGYRGERIERNRDRFGDDYRGDDRMQGRRGRGRPEGYDYEDRGFFDRAGDEVRSWFGDEEAERRRDMDQRYDDRMARAGRHQDDPHYMQWRRQRIAELDRDYDEYRRENAERFHNEFSSFRTERQGQRDSLSRVEEHMEVVGSDGNHVGTVDKVRGDRILLTKNDKDAGGHHHSIPSRWIDRVEDKKVTIRKTADQAHAHWRDEERNMAFFRDEDEGRGEHVLNRSFAGTY